MAFSEAVKKTVKRKAHFSCCLRRSLWVEVHHVGPQAEGGEDSEANAAPLCPSCHETYGANPDKRKFIREARELWYEICEKRYATDPDRLDELSEQLKHIATKADLDAAITKVTELMRSVAASETRPVEARLGEVARLGSMIAPSVGANRNCINCGTRIGLLIGDQGRCPNCGTPW
jgi:hypothetical protein